MSGADDEVFHVHQQPVWRERADFVINVALPEHRHYEQLWAQRRTDDTFEICCIPFFANDVSLGDVVETRPQGPRRYMVSRVVQPSGRTTFRLWLGASTEQPPAIEAEAVALGALTEWSSRNLLAIDAPDIEHAQVVADWLAEGERRGRWLYETGAT